MATTGGARDDRIELRATKEEKRLLATAAAHERLDVTSFIMRNVVPAARAVVERTERIVLSERDTVRVLELLENPPKPTPALMAAARRAGAKTKRPGGATRARSVVLAAFAAGRRGART